MKKEIIGALLSGVAIIALSGCSSGPKEMDIDEVKITDLENGRAVTFIEIVGDSSVALKEGINELADGSGNEYIYKFCPLGKEAATVQAQEFNADGSYQEYEDGSLYRKGLFKISDNKIIFDNLLEIGTNETGKLEVDNKYEVTCSDPLQVTKIEIITCAAAEEH